MQKFNHGYGVVMGMNHKLLKADLAKRYGFDRQRIAQRLSLLGLGLGDQQLSGLLQQKVIQPNMQEIIGQFYRIMLQDAEFISVINQQVSLERLQQTMYEYLSTLGRGFDEPEYFNQRLKIGLIHMWTDISLSLYQCSFRLLQQILIDFIPSGHKKRDILIAYILKITHLDMSLAIEAYVSQTVTKLTGEAEKFRKLHEMDSLTGLLSRAAMEDCIEQDLAAQKDFFLLMLDLDHFKNINDQYGHLVGDEVLRIVAQRLQKAVRDSDRIGRFGGEEFVALIRQDSLSRVLDISERIRLSVCREPVESNELVIEVSISIGLTKYHPDDTVAQLLERADQALYRAKQSGRNCVEVNE